MLRQLTRRAFLRLTAGSSLAFAAGGLGQQFPSHWISAPLPPEMHVKPVRLIRYATTCRECPAGCGMHVRHVNGRAIKAEGNPDHPVNRGGLCARGQSALQGLYDPDRLTAPMRRSRSATSQGALHRQSWHQVLRDLGAILRRTRGRVHVISRLETGALAAIMGDFAEAFDGRLLFFEAFDYQPLRQANEAMTGAAVIPWHHLDNCENVLSFGADFLESWVSNVQYAWMFGAMHACREKKAPGTFAYVGPRLSMTAANADTFIKLPASSAYDFAMNMLKVMAERGWVRNDDLDYGSLSRQFAPEVLPIRDAAATIERLARQFSRSRKSAALAGPMAAEGWQAQQLALAVFLLNRAAGNIGDTIDFTRTHALGKTSYRQELVQLLDDLTAEDIVIFHETNPAFILPELQPSIRQAGQVVVLTQMPDETSLLADWLLPVDNPLEAWGDYSPWTGIRGYMQPTMNRLYDSRAAGDILLSLADIGGRPLARRGGGGQHLDFLSWLRAEWLEGEGSGEEQRRENARSLLTRGFSLATRQERPRAKLEKTPSSPLEPNAPPQASGDTAELWVWPSIFFFDGRTANRGWLQENPQPVSYIAWGSWAEIHPRKAASLGIERSDGLELRAGDAVVSVPVRITGEIDENTVGLALGQGHWALGGLAAGRGENAFALIARNDEHHMFGRITLARHADLGEPICLTASRHQHEREIVRWEKYGEASSAESPRIDLPLPQGFVKKDDIYEGHDHAGHRWAMAIDLHRCIGCGACAVACYAENNIPVLGPEKVREGREMAWLKVIPYAHPHKLDRIGFIPLPCQHCDQAPCEPVCPVFAAVHTEDGLNAQVYNRCIGTRYCSQNCPYKVRRFNWFDTVWTPPLEWQLNPEVTVRCRGVMEKCTFCVQRIRQAEYRARLENRPIADGEIQPACAQSCPTRVYTFGDLHDTDSAVHRLFNEDPRRYQLLHELNTKPAVLYLKRVEQEEQ